MLPTLHPTSLRKHSSEPPPGPQQGGEDFLPSSEMEESPAGESPWQAGGHEARSPSALLGLPEGRGVSHSPSAGLSFLLWGRGTPSPPSAGLSCLLCKKGT